MFITSHIPDDKEPNADNNIVNKKKDSKVCNYRSFRGLEQPDITVGG